MSKSIECEPFLIDYISSFHNIFIPIDKSMCTSEIKPLHLSLPRNRQGVRTTNTTSPATPKVNIANNEPNNTSDTNNEESTASPVENKKATRILSNHYLSQNESSKNGKNSRSSSKESPSPYKGIEKVAQKILPKTQPKPNSDDSDNTNTQSQDQESPSQPTQPTQPTQPSRQKLVVTTQNDREIAEMLIRNPDYWHLPLSPSAIVRLIFTASTISSKYNFDLFLEGDEVPIMSAEMNGTSRSDGINFMVGRRAIGETRYTPGNSSLFAGIMLNEGQLEEVCATIFNPSFSSASQPRIFDFLVPALKKINGKSRMLPIPFDESSGLVARLSQMSKEAIRLKTRIPASQGNSFDMTFDGKFQQLSLSNFILYHDSNTRKDLCALGMISSGRYLLEISYPLSPIQGFLAAISATAPF